MKKAADKWLIKTRQLTCKLRRELEEDPEERKNYLRREILKDHRFQPRHQYPKYWRKVGDTPDMTIIIGIFEDGRQTRPMGQVESNILINHISNLRNKEIEDRVEDEYPTIMCDVNFWKIRCTTKYCNECKNFIEL